MHTQLESTQQVFLLERDGGVLCRVLALYAARGIDIEHAEYAHAAPQTMVLTVTAEADAELMRILVAKAASLFGVVEAAERGRGGRLHAA